MELWRNNGGKPPFSAEFFLHFLAKINNLESIETNFYSIKKIPDICTWHFLNMLKMFEYGEKSQVSKENIWEILGEKRRERERKVDRETDLDIWRRESLWEAEIETA